jgi:hypothetical protein
MADDRQKNTDTNVEGPPLDPTAEVGGEGGSFGNVEIGVDQGAGTGSEAGETWRPTEEDVDTVVRDETGEGRRSP